MGVLVAPMTLAHPLYPIRCKSRYKCRNLWVGLCVSSWRPYFSPVYSMYYIHTIYYSWWYDTVILSCLVSNVHFISIFQDSLHHHMDRGTMWHSALVSCIPSKSLGPVWECAVFWCWVSLCAPFAISVIAFYFIMIFIMIVVAVIAIFITIPFILNNTFRLSINK